MHVHVARRARGRCRRLGTGQGRQHLRLGAVHHHTAGVDHQHAVHQLQHRRPVRDHHQRAIAAGLLQLAQEGDFTLRIHRTRGLVHEQDLRPRHQAARQRNQLTLAARQQHAALAHRQFPALGVCRHQPVQARQTRDIAQPRRVGRRAVEQHVVAQRAAEQARVLGDEADARAVVGGVDLAQVHAVGLDVTFGGLVQASQQAQHRALAAADAAQHGDAFAGFEAQRHALQHSRPGLTRATRQRVGKAGVDQADATRQIALGHIDLARLALDRLLHHVVQRAHRGARALVARGQLHDAGQRRQRTAGEHHRADQRAGGDDLLVDQEHAPHQHHERDRLLRDHADVQRPVADLAGAQHAAGECGRGFLVLAQEAALRARGLHVLDAVHGLDQHAVQVGRLLHVRHRGAAQSALDQRRHRQQQRDRNHQHPAQRPADDEGHGDEDDDERQVRQRRQRGRGKELAHLLDLRQVVRVSAGGVGPLLHAQRQRLAEQQAADDEVGLAAGHVDQVGAQLARHEVEGQRDAGAGGQCPQRDVGLVRQHLVVDDRGHEACDQHQHVAQHRGHQRRAVVGCEAPHRAPQPVAARVAQQLGVLRRGTGCGQRRGHQRDAGVLGGQFGFAGLAGVVLAARHDDVVALHIGGVARHHDAGVAFLEQQHCRQQQVVQLADLPLHQPGAEAGAAQGAQRLVGPESARHRQARQQRLGRALAAVVPRQPADGVGQRVVVGVPGRRSARRRLSRAFGGGCGRVAHASAGDQAAPAERASSASASNWASMSHTMRGRSNSGEARPCSAR